MMGIDSEPTVGGASFTELLESKRRLEALISSSIDAIIAIDTKKKIITVNRQAEILLGYSGSELIGKSVEGLYVDKEKARKVYDAIQDEGMIGTTELVLVQKNGGQISIMLSGKQIVDEKGTILGQVGYMRDQRDIQNLETRLKELIETSKTVNSIHKLHEILEHVIQSVLRAIPVADRGSIHFYDGQSRKLILKVSSFDYARKTWGSLGFEIGVGLAGWVFEQQQPIIVENTIEDIHFKPSENLEVKILSMLCIPITSKSRQIGVMTLSNSKKTETFTPDDSDLLIGYAGQAAIAIENAEQMTKMKNEAEELEFLHETSLKLNRLSKNEDILTTLVETGNKLLNTEMAVVHWRGMSGEKIQTFVAPEELQYLATEPRQEGGLTDKIFSTGEPVIISDAPWDKRVNREVINLGIQSLAGYPLQLGGRVAGVIFFNSRKPRFFQEEESRLISLLLPTAAVALENADTITRLEQKRSLSASLVEGSSRLATCRTMNEQMTALKGFMCEKLHAPTCFLGLYNTITDQIDFHINYEKGADQGFASDDMKYKDSPTISSFVFREWKQLIWLDKEQKESTCRSSGIKPMPTKTECQTCVTFPLIVEEKCLGVISIQSEEPYAWDEAEISSFQTLAHQAAIAIRKTQLMEESDNSFKLLKSTYTTSQQITSERNPIRALDMLVNSIPAEFGAWRANAVLLNENNKPYHLAISAGFDQSPVLSRIVREEGISAQVFRSRRPWFNEDIRRDPRGAHPEMFKQGVRAAACLPLTCKDARLGVLWLHYNQPRCFLEREKETLSLYTNQAAIAYENARLHQQLNKAHERTAIVAQMMTVGNLRSTLNAIVTCIKDVLGCDIVTLYSYRQEKGVFDPLPAVAGTLSFPEKITGTLLPHTAPYKIIELDDIRVSEDSRNDPILGSPFTVRENVQSSVGVPLKAQDKKVGALFINYCEQKHHFTPDELQNIRLFASQAIVAIRNAFLYTEVQERTKVMGIIDEAGRTVTSSLQLDKIFNNLAQQARRLTGEKGIIAMFASINLVEGNHTVLQAAYPQDEKKKIISANVAKVDLEHGIDGRIGIIGRAVKDRKPVLIREVDKHPDFLPSNPKTKSELAVPIFYREEVIGVINIEHSEIDGLDLEDQQNIQSLAAHAAVAIQNARMYQSLERKSIH